jgi:hypothetical protein
MMRTLSKNRNSFRKSRKRHDEETFLISLLTYYQTRTLPSPFPTSNDVAMRGIAICFFSDARFERNAWELELVIWLVVGGKMGKGVSSVVGA